MTGSETGDTGVLPHLRRALTTVQSRRLHRWPWFSITILVTAVLVGILAPWISPHPVSGGDLRARLTPPAWMEGGTASHPLGTDTVGRDMATRLLHGARVSLYVAVIGGLVTAGVGAALGMIAGYLGGWTDRIIMRLVDISLSLPSILFALVLALTIGAGMGNIILVISLIFWGRFARQVRGDVLSIKERDYVALAKVAGVSAPYIMVRHILPNILDNLVVLATLVIGQLILLESTLSYLGLGIPPPTPSWGNMVAEGRNFLAGAWWVSTLPGLAMLLVVLAANLLGDWVRDRLDPRLRHLDGR